MTEPSRIDHRIATFTTVVLLVLGSGALAVGAISAADTLIDADPGQRALSRDGAVLGVRVVPAEADDQMRQRPHRGSGPDDHHGHARGHRAFHAGPGVAAQITLERDDRGHTFAAPRGILHVDLRSGLYALAVQTSAGTASTELDVYGITHVLARVHDNGTTTFEIEHHMPHAPPFGDGRDHGPPHRDRHADHPGHAAHDGKPPHGDADRDWHERPEDHSGGGHDDASPPAEDDGASDQHG